MPLSTQPYKGARDFYPEDQRIRDYVFSTMRSVVKSYGYEEYDAPILEPLELYMAKSGEEIVNEQTYNFTDRGGRDVAIRPEMTPTVSRMVAARRQELAYPLRWFSIPNLWRYERPQRGRLREHWQLNVDIFGDESLAADQEVIAVADTIMKSFGAQSEMYQIKINSRVLTDKLFRSFLDLTEDETNQIIKLIDKKSKIDPLKFDASAKDIIGSKAGMLNDLLRCKTVNDLPDQIKSYESVSKLRELIRLLEDSSIDNISFDISLMRGFDYYTDIVFEVFDSDPDNNRSMFGGGRYDGLVGLFGVEPVPTVGFGMGDVTIYNFLESHNLMPKLETETDLLILLVSEVYPDAIKLAAQLRNYGINVGIDATNRKIDKKIKSADKQGIAHVLFIGESEIAQNSYPLKNLRTGNEEKYSAEQIANIIKDSRS